MNWIRFSEHPRWIQKAFSSISEWNKNPRRTHHRHPGFGKYLFSVVSTRPVELDTDTLDDGDFDSGDRYDNAAVGRVVGGEVLLRQQFGRWFWGWIAYLSQRSEKTGRVGDFGSSILTRPVLLGRVRDCLGVLNRNPALYVTGSSTTDVKVRCWTQMPVRMFPFLDRSTGVSARFFPDGCAIG